MLVHCIRPLLAVLLLFVADVRGFAAPSLSLQNVAQGLSFPVDIARAGDGSGRVFIVEQAGQIKILTQGQILPTPFLNITSLIVSGGEQGLLGLAFHPQYSSNGFFYVNYTRQGDGATVIARYHRSSNPDVADPSSAAVVLTVSQPFANHNGGQLQFGPDGYLYIGLGDGGSANDPSNRAQSLNTLLGKMLRIDVDSAFPYTIPADNPFRNDGDPNTLGEIWAFGLRNPWRFSFDSLTGDLFIADVGQSSWEEVNLQPSSAAGGKNYGWRVMEGAHCTGLSGSVACFAPSLTLPILEYDHSQGCSITGGYRYRGSASPALTGYYVYGDFCSGKVWVASSNSQGEWNSVKALDTGLSISTFGQDEAGEIYVAGYNNGTIYRIVATGGSVAKSDFNGDAKSDLVWQHTVNGQIGTWFMDGAALISSQFFSPSEVPDTSWEIVGVDDFNADGKPDLVWRHARSGQIGVWFMNGTTLVSAPLFNPGTVTDTSWKIATTGDFNGDGKPDLVWQRDGTGEIGVWFMNGTTLISASFFNPSQESNTRWKIVAAGDFNHDGKPDLVWQHSDTGDIRVWFMDGINRISEAPFTPNQIPDPNWKLVGVGDFNRDGQLDLIWQHGGNGQIGVWYMNATQLVSWTLFTPGQVPDLNWKIRNH